MSGGQGPIDTTARSAIPAAVFAQLAAFGAKLPFGAVSRGPRTAGKRICPCPCAQSGDRAPPLLPGCACLPSSAGTAVALAGPQTAALPSAGGWKGRGRAPPPVGSMCFARFSVANMPQAAMPSQRCGCRCSQHPKPHSGAKPRMAGERIREVKEETTPCMAWSGDTSGCAHPPASARTVLRAQSGRMKDRNAPKHVARPCAAYLMIDCELVSARAGQGTGFLPAQSCAQASVPTQCRCTGCCASVV